MPSSDRDILEELLRSDPSLKGREAELERAVSVLRANRPDTGFDEAFARRLKASVLNGSDRFPGAESLLSDRFRRFFIFATSGASVAFAAYALTFTLGDFVPRERPETSSAPLALEYSRPAMPSGNETADRLSDTEPNPSSDVSEPVSEPVAEIRTERPALPSVRSEPAEAPSYDAPAFKKAAPVSEESDLAVRTGPTPFSAAVPPSPVPMSATEVPEPLAADAAGTASESPAIADSERIAYVGKPFAMSASALPFFAVPPSTPESAPMAGALMMASDADSVPEPALDGKPAYDQDGTSVVPPAGLEAKSVPVTTDFEAVLSVAIGKVGRTDAFHTATALGTPEYAYESVPGSDGTSFAPALSFPVLDGNGKMLGRVTVPIAK